MIRYRHAPPPQTIAAGIVSQSLAVYLIAALTILGILIRPKGRSEAVWACLGAAFLIIFKLLSIHQALIAVRKGTDVYLFLTGMMLLAELARREGLFDWLASHAVLAARGSQIKLFTLIYAVGVLVTAFLSKDATAVVLTPAVYAAVKKARAAVVRRICSSVRLSRMRRASSCRSRTRRTWSSSVPPCRPYPTGSVPLPSRP